MLKRLATLLFIASLSLSAHAGDVGGGSGTGASAAWSTITGKPAGFADDTDNTGASGAILDLADDAADESTSIAEIAVTGDTNAIFSEPSADKLLISVGNAWPIAALAQTGDSATAFFGAGTIEDARIDGSTEADELVLAGDVDGTANANDLDELAVESELEAVLDLPQLQGQLALATQVSGILGDVNIWAGIARDTEVTSVLLNANGSIGFGTGLVPDGGLTAPLASPNFTGDIRIPRATAFPGSPGTGDTVVITDDSAIGACDSAAGSTRTICQYNGSAWQSIGDGAAGGFGTIVGTSGSTDNAIIRADGTGGSAIQGASPTISDTGLITGTDQTVEPGNVLSVYDNDTAFTNDPTCANSGASGSLTFVDKDEGSGDSFVQCNGTTEITEMWNDVVFCGDSFNTTTGYIGPGTANLLGGITDYTINSAACQALDSTTEATADAPLATDWPAFKVNGLYCRLSSDPASDVVVSVRSAAAELVPPVTCTIAGTGSATSCRTTLSSTTDVAAGATVAVKVVTLENLSAQDVWCKLYTVLR